MPCRATFWQSIGRRNAVGNRAEWRHNARCAYTWRAERNVAETSMAVASRLFSRHCLRIWWVVAIVSRAPFYALRPFIVRSHARFAIRGNATNVTPMCTLSRERFVRHKDFGARSVTSPDLFKRPPRLGDEAPSERACERRDRNAAARTLESTFVCHFAARNGSRFSFVIFHVRRISKTDRSVSRCYRSERHAVLARSRSTNFKFKFKNGWYYLKLATYG